MSEIQVETACPMCTRQQEAVGLTGPYGRKIVKPGQVCNACGASLDAAMVQARLSKTKSKPEGPRERLEAELDQMLADTDWAEVPLAKKLAIAAGVARS